MIPWLSLTAAVVGSHGSCSVAIVSDAAKEQHALIAADFPAVGAIGEMGTATLISEQWILTAAHAVDFLRLRGQESPVFSLADGREFAVDQIVIHPDWVPLEQQMASRKGDEPFGNRDIALLRLQKPITDVEPIELGSFDASTPEVSLVGIGVLVVDPTAGISMRDAMGLPRGTKYAGSNRIDRVDEERGELIFAFDEPGTAGATEHEVSPTAGDSGGPVISRTPDGWTVVGVIASVESGNDRLGDYGDQARATSIATVRDWIDASVKANTSD